MKLKVINNADDFGYSQGANYGIVDAHRLGALTSTTLMANMPAFEQAVELAKENPELGIGVHCTLTCGRPLLKGLKTLTDEKGNFKALSSYLNQDIQIDSNEVYQECKAQIEKIISAGIQPTHLDSHHHVHRYKENVDVFVRLAKEFDLPLRNSNKSATEAITDESFEADEYKKHSVKFNDILIDPYVNSDGLTNEEIVEKIVDTTITQLEANKDLPVIEVMWHPAYVDFEIMTGSCLNTHRLFETKALQSEKLRHYLAEHCELCTFREI